MFHHGGKGVVSQRVVAGEKKQSHNTVCYGTYLLFTSYGEARWAIVRISGNGLENKGS